MVTLEPEYNDMQYLFGAFVAFVFSVLQDSESVNVKFVNELIVFVAFLRIPVLHKLMKSLLFVSIKPTSLFE